MVAIKLGAPSSISVLAEYLGLERTTLTRNLKLLEKEGLIEIGPEGHRRARAIKLSQQGEEKLGEALPIWRKTQDRLIETVTPECLNEARKVAFDIVKMI